MRPRTLMERIQNYMQRSTREQNEKHHFEQKKKWPEPPDVYIDEGPKPNVSGYKDYIYSPKQGDQPLTPHWGEGRMKTRRRIEGGMKSKMPIIREEYDSIKDVMRWS